MTDHINELSALVWAVAGFATSALVLGLIVGSMWVMWKLVRE